eukprot:scaffold6880_cov110-Isochrysis_galbana.AAC.21
MTPEDREPDAPDMPHAESHTPLHGHTPHRRRAFRQARHTTLRQREGLAAPAAACTCPAREAASAIARALPPFVCVESWRENQNRSSGDVPII